jgi:hypothetical protein
MNDSSLIKFVSAQLADEPRPTKAKLTERAGERHAAIRVHEGSYLNRWSGLHAALADALADAREARSTKANNVQHFAAYNKPVPAEVAAADSSAEETTRRIADRAQEDLTIATRVNSDMRGARKEVDLLVGGLTEPVNDVDPEGMEPGLTPKEGVAAELTLQRTIRAEAKRVKAARLGPDADLAALEATLDKRAAAPEFEIVQSGGAFVARFPIVATGGEPRGGDLPNAPDYLVSFIKANKKKMLAEAKEVIDDFYLYDDVLVLTDAEKRSHLSKLAADLLASERREASWVWQALAQGEAVAFRPDLAPVAILGITGMPPRRRV